MTAARRCPAWRRATLAALAALGLACGHGATQYSGDAPSPAQIYGQCAFCHADEASSLAAHGGHGSFAVKCERCHADRTPGSVGCGHAAIPRCPDCHRQQITHHDPAVAAPQQCTICHDAHGSPNLLLVRTEVPLSDMANMTTPCAETSECALEQVCATGDAACGTATVATGCAAPIVFTNLAGRADGSFASASMPGTGVCEVCHTTTRYYRADGTGEEHFTFACYPCHPHARGFVPVEQ